MSDQQAMMAAQNPQMAQQLAMQNPEIAQQFMQNMGPAQHAALQLPNDFVMPGAMAAASSGMPNLPNDFVMPGAQAAASSGMNAPNVETGINWKSPEMLKAYGALGGIGQKLMQRPQGALMQPMPMMPGRPTPQQGSRPQMGALYQARPSRIY